MMDKDRYPPDWKQISLRIRKKTRRKLAEGNVPLI